MGETSSRSCWRRAHAELELVRAQCPRRERTTCPEPARPHERTWCGAPSLRPLRSGPGSRTSHLLPDPVGNGQRPSPELWHPTGSRPTIRGDVHTSTNRAVPPHWTNDDRRRGRGRTMPHRNARRSLSAVVSGPSVRVAQELVGLAQRGELCRGRLRVVRPYVRVQAVYCPAIGTRQLATGGVRPNPQDFVRIVHGHPWPQ